MLIDTSNYANHTLSYTTLFRSDGIGFSQDRLSFHAANRDIRSQMEGIAHRICSWTDLDGPATKRRDVVHRRRSEEHTSELQSPCNIVCSLLLDKKNY